MSNKKLNINDKITGLAKLVHMDEALIRKEIKKAALDRLVKEDGQTPAP